MTKKEIIAAIIEGQNQPSDLAAGFDHLLDFIAHHPDSETANSFAEFHIENHADSITNDGKPSFTYLIGREFHRANWVAEEDREAFRTAYLLEDA